MHNAKKCFISEIQRLRSTRALRGALKAASALALSTTLIASAACCSSNALLATSFSSLLVIWLVANEGVRGSERASERERDEEGKGERADGWEGGKERGRVRKGQKH
jgi:hypothetical protein